MTVLNTILGARVLVPPGAAVVRRNLATNPGYEVGTDSLFSASGGLYVATVETSSPIGGARSLLLTRAGALNSLIAETHFVVAGAAARIPVTGGQPITGGITVRTDVPGATILTRWYWFDAAVVSTAGALTARVTNVVAGQDYRVVDTGTPPANAVTARFVVTVAIAAGNAVVGQKAWFDRLTLEYGATDGSYFDGGVADTAQWRYDWAGTANASESTATRTEWNALVQRILLGTKEIVKFGTGVRTNLCSNPVPGSVTTWGTNNAGSWTHSYANGEISVNRLAAADANIAASVAATGVATSPALTLGANYQRSVEVWVDQAATVVNRFGSGYAGGQALPAGVWTRVVEQFVKAAAGNNTLLEIQMPGVGTGVHVKLRKAQLAANPGGLTLPYFDGTTPDAPPFHDYGWTGAADASTSTDTYYERVSA